MQKNTKSRRFKMKIKAGDTIKVMVGKDKGKTGKIEKVFPQQNKVLVDGLNVYKRHLKPKGEGKPGGIVDFSRPLVISNVALQCPKCQKVTRVGFNFDKQGNKSRICKKCRQPL